MRFKISSNTSTPHRSLNSPCLKTIFSASKPVWSDNRFQVAPIWCLHRSHPVNTRSIFMLHILVWNSRLTRTTTLRSHVRVDIIDGIELVPGVWSYKWIRSGNSKAYAGLDFTPTRDQPGIAPKKLKPVCNRHRIIVRPKNGTWIKNAHHFWWAFLIHNT